MSFRFKPGDQILSYGVEHWTNHTPLTVTRVLKDRFIARSFEGAGEFEYHQGPGDIGLQWRRYMRHEEPEIFIPSADVCAYCGDQECDGACFMAIDPQDEDQQAEFERVQDLIRWGRLWEAAQAELKRAENR